MRYLFWAVTTWMFVFSICEGARAADGIKASATVTRKLRADIAIVSFQASDINEAGDTDRQFIFIKAFEAKNLRILESHIQYLLVNNFHRPNVAAMAGSLPPRQRQLSFRLTGFQRIDDVLDVLMQIGGAQNLTISMASSESETVSPDMETEAIQKAIAQAKTWGSASGVKAGNVIDLAVQFAPGANYNSSVIVSPDKPGNLPFINYSVTANVVLAIKSD